MGEEKKFYNFHKSVKAAVLVMLIFLMYIPRRCAPFLLGAELCLITRHEEETDRKRIPYCLRFSRSGIGAADARERGEARTAAFVRARAKKEREMDYIKENRG